MWFFLCGGGGEVVKKKETKPSNQTIYVQIVQKKITISVADRSKYIILSAVSTILSLKTTCDAIKPYLKWYAALTQLNFSSPHTLYKHLKDCLTYAHLFANTPIYLFFF